MALVFIYLFFSYYGHWAEQAEEASRKLVVNNLRQSMNLVMMELTVKDKLDQAPQYLKINPFEIMQKYFSLPFNYHGEYSLQGESSLLPGWHFDTLRKEVVYRSQKGVVKRFRVKMKDVKGVRVLELKEAPN